MAAAMAAARVAATAAARVAAAAATARYVTDWFGRTMYNLM